MVLAHLTYKPLYRYFFSQLSSEHTVILDNGQHELNEPIRGQELLRIFGGLSPHYPDYLVLPDELDPDVNYDCLEEAIEQVVPVCRNLNPSVQFIAVPHDIDSEGAIEDECADFAEFPDVTVIGLNKMIELLNSEGRAGVVERLVHHFGERFKYHLLGCRVSPQEAGKVAEKDLLEYVVGIDSSLPYRLASRGRRLTDIKPNPAALDFSGPSLSGPLKEFAYKELEQYARWVEGL